MANERQRGESPPALPSLSGTQSDVWQESELGAEKVKKKLLSVSAAVVVLFVTQHAVPSITAHGPPEINSYMSYPPLDKG